MGTVRAALALLLAGPGLAAQQLEWSGGVTAVGQLASDPRVRDEVVSSLDLFFDLGLGPVVLATYIEANTTPFGGGVSQLIGEANTDAGTAVDARRRGRVQISEVRLVVPVVADLRAHAGILDATGYLDVSRIANDENLFFLGVPFVNNPTIEFPDYALGGALEGTLPVGLPLRIGATFLSSHGLADNPNVSYAQLLDLGEEGKGVFVGTALRWVTPGARVSVGGWVNTAEHPLLAGSGGTEQSRGAFSVVGWSRGEHALSARAGVANGSVSVVRGFTGVTYLFVRRPNALGLAIGRSFASDDTPGLSDVTHAEVFARRRLYREIFFTASVQRIVNSGFDASGVVVAPTVWVGGVRLSAQF